MSRNPDFSRSFRDDLEILGTGIERLTAGFGSLDETLREMDDFRSTLETNLPRRRNSRDIENRRAYRDGSKLNGRVSLASIIYEEGVENVTFQHRLRDECSPFRRGCVNEVRVFHPPLSQWNSQRSFPSYRYNPYISQPPYRTRNRVIHPNMRKELKELWSTNHSNVEIKTDFTKKVCKFCGENKIPKTRKSVSLEIPLKESIGSQS
ncbi:hypothetical protein TNIN_237251 [Trichonephila inaurata madagascariensis]|uniref:Uncharacterized protein n=1 Tax=Trichonephila inaurata madagascariensis TaxID=2747483 RepID=A0A8X7BTM7_9ARAC|nr:hypothetical protein TNIN_237251 [Trichonephila inaurata madagascariensis]